MLIGGAPWRISRLAQAAGELASRVASAGSAGLVLNQEAHLRIARVLLDRGLVDPMPADLDPPGAVEVVIPVFNDSEGLAKLLGSMPESRSTVVDDGSQDSAHIADLVASSGGTLLRHRHNLGPAAARNTGLARTRAPFIAFIDADCIATPDWAHRLLHHFHDPRVAAVAPRVLPESEARTLLQRYEQTRSSLDMGPTAELVLHGARRQFVPSAALVVRRASLTGPGFDEGLRVGEDVDLVWRLTQAGWLVRYDPSVTVRHRMRAKPSHWFARRYRYGTSAPALEHRHPGQLAPARPSAWTLSVLALAAAKQPAIALSVTGAACGLLWWRLRGTPHAAGLAARTVAQGTVADAASLGHLLRREWWPAGWAALAAAPAWRPARLAALTMIAPLAWDWAIDRPGIDPVRYAALRLLDDAAYGSGVIASCARARMAAPLIPVVRWPRAGPRPGRSALAGRGLPG